MSLTKECSDCETEKPIAEFHKNGRGVTKLHGESSTRKPYCKECSKIRNRKDREGIRNRNIRWRYGIEYEDLLAMFKEQNGRCKICDDEMELFASKSNKALVCHVDHDHKSGKVRGLLCGSCNTGIGKFKDNVDILQSAIEYLGEHYVN